MNKPLVFKILYYICFLFSMFIWIYASNLIDIYAIDIRTFANTIFGILNLILVIIFIIKSFKTKLNNANILFPIVYLIFSIIVVVLAFIMNSKLIIPYIHFSYYISFILFDYLLLNLYSVLSIYKK